MAKEIATTNAPAAVGPYSQALAVGPFVFASGQIPLDPATGAIKGETAAEQAQQVFTNIEAVLSEAGLSMADVVKSTVFLTDLADFGAVNEVYATRFVKPFPARSCVEVSALPKGAKVECEVIAYKG
ncbi:MAG: RidA family protein [Solobacterium sp.]|nr:RidA family protein [Solobacterium sp.]